MSAVAATPSPLSEFVDLVDRMARSHKFLHVAGDPDQRCLTCHQPMEHEAHGPTTVTLNADQLHRVAWRLRRLSNPRELGTFTHADLDAICRALMGKEPL